MNAAISLGSRPCPFFQRGVGAARAVPIFARPMTFDQRIVDWLLRHDVLETIIRDEYGPIVAEIVLRRLLRPPTT